MEKSKQRFKKLNQTLADKIDETKFEKLKSFSSGIKEKENRKNPKQKKLKDDKKISKNEFKYRVKSLRRYIKQKWKWIILLFVTYITIFGVVVSIPIVFYHSIITNENVTEQERFIT